MARAQLTVGDPAPWFTARSTSNPQYHFNVVAGRYVVLCFFGSASEPVSQRILSDFLQNRNCFDDDNFCFFGVSIDPEDERLPRVRQQVPGIRYFWDFDLKISHLFGAVDREVIRENASTQYYRLTVVLDERLRILAVLPFDEQPETYVARLMDFLTTLPPLGLEMPATVPAPVLVVPRVFEPEFCRTLIRYYDERGGEESGFMREVEGKTVGVMDYTHKRRRDQELQDELLCKAAMIRIHNRLIPEIFKAFQFRATRIERYIVACYESETGGYFRPHRDNTTKGTAHRRFAVSVNLNTGEYEGGDLRFPEFGRQTYRPPAGGAVVFSCSLLHEATPVTQGKRYAFLPFLYDDASAKLRRENQQFLASSAPNHPET